MRILSRYFVLGYLGYYVAIILVSLLVIAIVEMMVNLDHVTEHGEGILGAASYLLLRLPSYYLPYLLPVGSYGAAFLCFGLPARSLEILATQTSGISPRRLALPVLAVASLLSAVSLVVNETIVLDAAARFNRSNGGEDALFQSRGAFWHQRGNTLFRVQSADRDDQTLQGVTIYERDARGRLVRSVQAETARIEPDQRWRLERALFRDFSTDEPEAAPRTELRETAWIELGRGGDLALLAADPRSLPLLGLRRYIGAIERDGRDATRYRALWHGRLAEPLSVLLFALLGIPLGVAVERSRSLAVAALEAIALLGAYYGLQTAASVLSSGGVAAAVTVPWGLLIAFGGFGAWRLARLGR